MVIKQKTVQKAGYGIDIVIGKIVAKLIIKLTNHGIKHFGHNQLELMYHPDYLKEIAKKLLDADLLNRIKINYSSFFKEINVRKFLLRNQKVMILDVQGDKLHILRHILRNEYNDPLIIVSSKNIKHIDFKHVADFHLLKIELKALLTNYLHKKMVESQDCVEVITNAVSRRLENKNINEYGKDALTEEELNALLNTNNCVQFLSPTLNDLLHCYLLCFKMTTKTSSKFSI